VLGDLPTHDPDHDLPAAVSAEALTREVVNATLIRTSPVLAPPGLHAADHVAELLMWVESRPLGWGLSVTEPAQVAYRPECHECDCALLGADDIVHGRGVT
jgi:hypothetical protein